jgi:hypothetical protein
LKCKLPLPGILGFKTEAFTLGLSFLFWKGKELLKGKIAEGKRIVKGKLLKRS